MSANADERLNDPSAEEFVRRKPSRAKYGCFAVGCALVFCSVVGIWRAIDWASKEAIRSQSHSPLNQLQLAFHCYHDVHGCFPPAYLIGDDGTPVHSWRVLILPHIDEEELYRVYDFEEPWNGPNNIRLADRMPTIYHCPSEPGSDSMTNYAVIVGEDTAFPFGKSTSYEDFEDGLGNTILLAEIAHSDIVWPEPRDLAVDQMSFRVNDDGLPSISSSRRRGPMVVTAGGVTTYEISERLRPETLEALTTIAGHEELSMAACWDGGLESLGDGPVTDDTLSRFDRWQQVRYLWLTQSQITDEGTSRLTEAQRLQKLYLNETLVTDATLDHLNGLPGLEYVNLRGTPVTISGVLKLALSVRPVRIPFSLGYVENTHAFELGLSNAPLRDEDLQLLGTIAIPAWINLSGTAITGASLQHLGGLADLRELNLAGTQIADGDLAYIAKSTSPQELNLSGTKVADGGLEHLKALTILHTLILRNTEVTDAGLEHLEGLARLHRLDLDGTKVTEEGIQKLQEALPNCNIDH